MNPYLPMADLTRRLVNPALEKLLPQSMIGFATKRAVAPGKRVRLSATINMCAFKPVRLTVSSSKVFKRGSRPLSRRTLDAYLEDDGTYVVEVPEELVETVSSSDAFVVEDVLVGKRSLWKGQKVKPISAMCFAADLPELWMFDDEVAMPGQKITLIVRNIDDVGAMFFGAISGFNWKPEPSACSSWRTYGRFGVSTRL